jgi:hypothetical protein
VYDRDQWRFIVNTEAGSELMWYRKEPVAFLCKHGSWIWIDVVQEWDQWLFFVNTEAGSGLMWYMSWTSGVSF